MKRFLIGIAALFLATGAAHAPANAYELRCQTYYYGNQSYSRCVPWYTEQELYQQNQAGRINDPTEAVGAARVALQRLRVKPRSRPAFPPM